MCIQLCVCVYLRMYACVCVYVSCVYTRNIFMYVGCKKYLLVTS